MPGIERALPLFVFALAAEVGCGGSFAPSAAPSPDMPPDAALLPARVRRLTNLELERSVGALVGKPEALAEELPPDVRSDGYTPNANQDVSAAWALRYSALVRELTRRAASERLNELAPCSKTPSDACKRDVIETLGRSAFRRALNSDEKSSLLATFADGEQGGAGFAAGLALLLRALLESPHFVYVTELGDGGKPGDVVTLTDAEIASELAYTLRGGPPDEELLQAAERGTLRDPEQRAAQARRLLGESDTRHHFRRFVLEWLEVDGLLRTAKSERLYPDYERLKPFMLNETQSFVDEVMVHAGGSVAALLGAGFVSVEPEMARFYGLTTYGPRATLGSSGRLGILQQASFLAAHAHEDSTSPVKRGDFVMRKLLCEQVKRPAEIGIEVVMPPPSTAITTRERFAAHEREAGCAGCHQALDAFGFAFESFDAMGGRRREENGKPIDSAVTVKLGDEALKLAGSVELSTHLAADPRVAECFARNAFRYFSAQKDAKVEATFLALRRELPAERQGNLFDALIAYLSSDLFVKREVKAP